jgi:hypothetical protein
MMYDEAHALATLSTQVDREHTVLITDSVRWDLMAY